MGLRSSRHLHQSRHDQAQGGAVPFPPNVARSTSYPASAESYGTNTAAPLNSPLRRSARASFACSSG